MKLSLRLLLALSTIFAVSASADVLELKSGKVLHGTYMGGSLLSIRFQINDELQVIPTQEILAVTFTGNGATVAPVTQAAPPATPDEIKASYLLPAGTQLMVRLNEPVDTRNNSAGDLFSGILETAVSINHQVLIPSGSVVYGVVDESNRGGLARKATLSLRLTSVVVKDQSYPIETSPVRGQGASAGTAKKLLKGAAIGALADGSDGAETGAKVGAGVAILAGGKDAGLASETLVSWTTTQAFTIDSTP